MRKKWVKFETKTLYANKLGPRAVTRRLEKNEIVVIYESFKAFVFMRKRTAIQSKKEKKSVSIKSIYERNIFDVVVVVDVELWQSSRTKCE